MMMTYQAARCMRSQAARRPVRMQGATYDMLLLTIRPIELWSRIPADLERIMSASAAARRHQRLRSLRASFRRYGPTSSRLLLAGGGGSRGGGCGHEARVVCQASLAGLVAGIATALTVSRHRRHAMVPTTTCGSLQPAFDATARAGMLCVQVFWSAIAASHASSDQSARSCVLAAIAYQWPVTHLDAIRHQCKAVGICAVSDRPRCRCRADKRRTAAVAGVSAAVERAAAPWVLHSGCPVAPTPRLHAR